MSCTISSPILLPDNIAIIIIPVIIAIVIIFVLIKMNIIKLDCLSIEQSENCAYVDDLSDQCKKEFFTTYPTYPTYPTLTYSNTNSMTTSALNSYYRPYTSQQISLIMNSYLKTYPPNKTPQILSSKYTISDGICGPTYISVGYDNNTTYKYEIYTSYTYQNNGKIENLVDNNSSTSWASLYNIYFQPPNYAGNNYLDPVTQTKGEWIYYKLPDRITLFNYTISSNNNRPRTWIFYGSNDGINWTVIEDASQKDVLNNTNYKDNKYTKYLYPINFQYFGIVITSITDGPGDFAAYISNIRFYGL
jgi:hypothetical protein